MIIVSNLTKKNCWVNGILFQDILTYSISKIFKNFRYHISRLSMIVGVSVAADVSTELHHVS